MAGSVLARINAAAPALRGLSARGKKRWAPHDPTPKQAEFLALDCLEALYGGAAGGGKSDALLMGALQYVHVPGYAAGVFRRTYADLALPNAIMDRAKMWLRPLGVKWNDTEKRFTFPSGATLTFGYCDTEGDMTRYQGAEFQYLAIDEASQWPERWYLYLLSRLRRPVGMPVPLRARLGSNPGGIGGPWVKERFVESADPDRVFVPALMTDNPFLDVTEYRRSLALLDPTQRRQLENGEWIDDSGGLVYGHFSPIRNVVREAPALTHHILGIDYGFNDACAFTVIGWRDHDPCVYIVSSTKEANLTPSEAGARTKELEATYGFERIVGDLGGMGKGYAEEGRRRFHLPIEAADKANKRGYIALMNGELANGRVKLVEAGTRELVAEWRKLPWNKALTREAEGFASDCSDCALYAWRAANAYQEEPAEEKPVAGSPEAYRREEEERLERRIAEVTPKNRDWWDV